MRFGIVCGNIIVASSNKKIYNAKRNILVKDGLFKPSILTIWCATVATNKTTIKQVWIGIWQCKHFHPKLIKWSLSYCSTLMIWNKKNLSTNSPGKSEPILSTRKHYWSIPELSPSLHGLRWRCNQNFSKLKFWAEIFLVIALMEKIDSRWF